MDKTVEVTAPDGANVVGSTTASSAKSYSCTPECEPRITLGDGKTFFDRYDGAECCPHRRRAVRRHRAPRLRTEFDARARFNSPSLEKMVSDALNVISLVLAIATTIQQHLFAITRSRCLSTVCKRNRRHAPEHPNPDYRPPASAVAARRRAPFCARARWCGGGRIRAGRGAVSCADLRHHGNRDGLLLRPDAGAAVAASARLIMTGQAQTARLYGGDLQEGGLRQIFGLFDCTERRLCRREDLIDLRQRST